MRNQTKAVPMYSSRAVLYIVVACFFVPQSDGQISASSLKFAYMEGTKFIYIGNEEHLTIKLVKDVLSGWFFGSFEL